MDSRGALRTTIEQGQNIVERYLSDLSDADLLVRPAKDSNHIAWQLGHLISGENKMVSAVFPDVMPPLPEGFGERHTKNTAASDDPQQFLTKHEYQAIFQLQRAGTLKALASVTDAQLDEAMPPPLSHFLKNVGAMFALQGTHWVMHAGQWAVIRRQLGKPPLF